MVTPMSFSFHTLFLVNRPLDYRVTVTRISMTEAQKKEEKDLQRLKQDRVEALASLSEQSKMSSAEAVANYNGRLARDQQTREAV